MLSDNTRPHWHSAASHRQIAGLIADFARFTDGRQWPALTRLLAPSVTLGSPNGPPGVVLSAEQFMSRWRAWLDGLGVTQHGLAAKHIAVYEIEATCFVDALITSCPDQ
ncbi:MAG: nuclear transport factor 2 family protein, partial [Bacteroidetes bacterium]|nr:nuclear transport factor 2 family protein [Fibrella sp.]